MKTMKVDQQEFDFLRELVYESASIVIEPGQEYLAEARLSSLAYAEGFSCVQMLLSSMRQVPSPRLHSQIVDAMTNNETCFYRDLEPFRALRDTIIPELLVRNADHKQLTLWSAAASTGQEAFSVVMLFEEAFGGLPGWRTRMIATDVSCTALARARAGTYNRMEIGRGLTPAQLEKHFRQEGTEWRIAENIRRQVEFFQLNLFDPWVNIPKCDIIFLRNVLIYFDVEKKRLLLAKIADVLKPSGYLLLGSAETTFGLDQSFERVPMGAASFYRQANCPRTGSANSG